MVQLSNTGSKPIADGAERIRARAESRRQEILRAAARVFRRQGYSATGMRAIAAEAGLSPGNLYHYFSGKEDLLFFCQDRSLNLLLESLEALEARDLDPPRRLFEAIRSHVEVLLDSMEGSAAHFELGELPPERRAPLIEKRDRYEAGLRSILDAGQKQKLFHPADPGVLAKTILGGVNWPALWFRHDGNRTPRELGCEIATYLTRGALRRPEEFDYEGWNTDRTDRPRAGSGARR